MPIVVEIARAGLEAVWDYIALHVLTCLVPAFLLAGAMVAFINKEAIMARLGSAASKPASFATATGASFFVAACSCTVIPVSSGIYYSGAGIGAAFILLWVAPASNLLSLIYTGNILGAEMIERLGLSSTPLSDVIKGSLKHAMQSRNLEEISTIIGNIRAQKGVERVFITDKRGTIKFSADPADIGRRLDVSDPTCQICHRVQAERRNKTVIFNGGGTERVFRNVNPIANDVECQRCHQATDRIIGVLISDFSMAEVDRELASKFKEMALSLILILSVTVVTIAFIMNRMVLDRLRRFVEATRSLGMGRLDQQVAVEGRDEIGQLAVAFNDMLEHLRRAKDLRERKELLESVLNNVEESIIVLDPEGTIISFSRGAETTFGYRPEEVLGRPYAVLGEGRGEVLESVKRGGIVDGEARLKSRPGRYFPARYCVMPLRNERDEVLAFVEIVRDLTEEKVRERLQQQLVQSEKLAAVGQLAAGVAHELNNPLGNILLHSKLLVEELEPGEPGQSTGKTIAENTLRCKAIVKNLLDYARESEVQMRLSDLNEIARSSVQMLANEMRIHNIEHRLELAESLPKVSCDRNQIQQVFVNLLQNAIQAIENHGQITVFTSSAKGGDGVLFGVRDNGVGIRAETLFRVFEPFYTTKEKGTGLGLSICYGIVRRHNGRIWAESPRPDEDPGGATLPSPGAAFSVELPLASQVVGG